MKWNEIKLNNSDTGFEYKEKPIFKSYNRVMSFHEEGLAAVYDDSGAYHIDTTGKPLYEKRYIETFGFYGGIATVRESKGYYHIDTKGIPIHKNSYAWSGNFQENRCVVQTSKGFNHITLTGKIVSDEFYRYCGDFRYGIAVVHSFADGVFHIDLNGQRINNKSYIDAGVYHKGFAVVADEKGYYHVDKKGDEIYSYRFKKSEVFYNGWALCEEFDGRKVRISEKGEKIYIPTYTTPLTASDLVTLVKDGKRVGLFFRHAERFTSKEVLTGNHVQLTENGEKVAKQLGEKLKELSSITLFSSPINRCIKTLEQIKKGAEVDNEIISSVMLGDPGCYVDPKEADICGEAMEENGFMNYTMSYLQNLKMTGSKNLSKASEELEKFIIENSKEGLTLFNSHDFLVAAFMRYTGVKYPVVEDYVEYLEGVVVVIDENDKINLHKFLEG